MTNIASNKKSKNSIDLNSNSDQKTSSGHLDTKAYFRQLKRRLRFGFLIAVVLPFAALSMYFHFQFTFTLKESAKLDLITIAESQRNTVDLFLQERIVNIFSQFQSKEFSLAPSRQTMENYLQNLRRVSDAFIDVGFLNENGTQTGYAGPFPYLQKPCGLDEIMECLKEAYKKKVMNRKKIEEKKMDDMLKISLYGSPREIMRRLKEIDKG